MASKILKWLTLSLVLAIALCGAGYWFAATSTNAFAKSKLAEIAARFDADLSHHKTHLQSDLDLLLETPIYTDLARIRNAEPYVRPHLTWDGDRSGSAPEGVEYENEKRVTAFLDRHPLKDLTSKSWSALLADPELERLQLSWLDDLISFDHFSLSTHPSHQQAIEQAKHANASEKLALASTLPYPRLTVLRAMATFRFAQLARDGKLDRAADLYRHVSYLIWTQNSLVSAMTAMSMLNQEHELENVVGSYPLPLIDRDRIEAMRSLSWFWGGAYRRLFVKDFVQPLRAYFTPETGACAGASESLAGVSTLATFFGPTALLEQDYAFAFKRAHRVEDRLIRMCNLEAYRTFFEESPPSREPLFVRDLNLFVVDWKVSGYPIPNPARVPLIRRAAGSLLLSVALPNAFSIYEKRERTPASK